MEQFYYDGMIGTRGVIANIAHANRVANIVLCVICGLIVLRMVYALIIYLIASDIAEKYDIMMTHEWEDAAQLGLREFHTLIFDMTTWTVEKAFKDESAYRMILDEISD